MKLKKIVSLALAGVLAVSMLAGCANKPGTTPNDPTTEPTNDLAAAVIAALDEDTTEKVTFTADSTLADTAAAVVAKYGYNNTTNFTDKNLAAIDTDLTEHALWNVATVKTEKDAKEAVKEASGTYAVAKAATALSGGDAAYAAKQLAKEIDTKVAQLEAESAVYDNDDGDRCRVEYSYTGKVAVVTAADATTGAVNYYLAYTITRTGTVAEAGF